MESSAPKRILVIDGGGLRGLASLMLIDELMKVIMARARKNFRPCEVFDLICGTSVGGFVAILLGRLGLDCATAIDYYKKAMDALLKDEGDRIWDNIAESRFLDTDELRKYLNKIVGKIAGSPDVSMKLAIEDGQDLRKHPTNKTFVTVQEGAPDYPSCAHLIRSYHVLNRHRGASRSTNRYWNIPEVVLATLASPLYLAPLSVISDKKCSFLDAGFCGHNNPIGLTMKEVENHWPKGRIETVLSFGTGLQGLLSDEPETIHVQKMCERLYRETLRQDGKNKDIDLNVTYAIRQMTRIAADSATAHQKFEKTRGTHCDNYYRIDDAFGLGPFDLVDANKVQILSDGIKSWLTEQGSKILFEIASKLVDEGEAIEDNRQLEGQLQTSVEQACQPADKGKAVEHDGQLDLQTSVRGVSQLVDEEKAVEDEEDLQTLVEGAGQPIDEGKAIKVEENLHTSVEEAGQPVDGGEAEDRLKEEDLQTSVEEASQPVDGGEAIGDEDRLKEQALRTFVDEAGQPVDKGEAVEDENRLKWRDLPTSVEDVGQPVDKGEAVEGENQLKWQNLQASVEEAGQPVDGDEAIGDEDRLKEQALKTLVEKADQPVDKGEAVEGNDQLKGQLLTSGEEAGQPILT